MVIDQYTPIWLLMPTCLLVDFLSAPLVGQQNAFLITLGAFVAGIRALYVIQRDSKSKRPPLGNPIQAHSQESA